MKSTELSISKPSPAQPLSSRRELMCSEPPTSKESVGLRVRDWYRTHPIEADRIRNDAVANALSSMQNIVDNGQLYDVWEVLIPDNDQSTGKAGFSHYALIVRDQLIHVIIREITLDNG